MIQLGIAFAPFVARNDQGLNRQSASNPPSIDNNAEEEERKRFPELQMLPGGRGSYGKGHKEGIKK